MDAKKDAMNLDRCCAPTIILFLRSWERDDAPARYVDDEFVGTEGLGVLLFWEELEVIELRGFVGFWVQV